MQAINSGDTAWMLISTVLVLMMTPALAFFYGGMVRAQERHLDPQPQLHHDGAHQPAVGLSTATSLAFGGSIGGLIGGLQFTGLTGVGAAPNADYAPTIPHLAFSAYQMMFAIITPALITGAFVERVRFHAS